jgi:hypothetical protein
MSGFGRSLFYAMKTLSDRLWERTGFTLFGWCALGVAAVSFAMAVVAHLWK